MTIHCSSTILKRFVSIRKHSFRYYRPSPINIYMKKNFLIAIGILLSPTVFSQFSISYNPVTGAVSSISEKKDANGMNWVFSSSDPVPSWQKPGQDWGMGRYSIRSQRHNWQTPSRIVVKGDASSVTYNTGDLEVDVSRSVTDGFFTETYTFRNISGNGVQVDSLGIFTPFNDNYPDARTCATNRCNAHIWAGLNSSYVNAIRMDGVPSHLGLVFTKGSMESYSLENRGLDGGSGYKASNVRGTIIMNIHSFKLKANERYTVQWKMFWHVDGRFFSRPQKNSGS